MNTALPSPLSLALRYACAVTRRAANTLTSPQISTVFLPPSIPPAWRFLGQSWGRIAMRVVASLALLGVFGGAQVVAQTVYRIVGPDGKVTYSDKPPANDAAGKVDARGASASGTGTPAALPFAVRQAMGKYPVTLYSAADCGPCASGRALLTRRGIPFAEKTIASNDDIEALRRLTGEGSVPILAVGGQLLRGYLETEWALTLTAAGYPETSQLPTSYRNPVATPLVEVEKVAAPKPETRPQRVAPLPSAPVTPAEPAEPTPPNPAGIKF